MVVFFPDLISNDKDNNDGSYWDDRHLTISKKFLPNFIYRLGDYRRNILRSKLIFVEEYLKSKKLFFPVWDTKNHATAMDKIHYDMVKVLYDIRNKNYTLREVETIKL